MNLSNDILLCILLCIFYIWFNCEF